MYNLYSINIQINILEKSQIFINQKIDQNDLYIYLLHILFIFIKSDNQFNGVYNKLLMIANKQNMDQSKQPKKCEIHKIQYDLVGNDKFCQLNCLICCDCLKTLDHQHKYEGINHKTITIIQLTNQFQKIRAFSLHQIKKCKQRLDAYMKKFTDWLMMEVEKQKRRLNKIIDNIMLTQITKKEDQLSVIEHLLHGEYQNLICKQVGGIAKKLFAFVPKQISAGYKRFNQYLEERETKMPQQANQLLKDPHYETIVLKDALTRIKYPDFDQPPPRVVTEPPSPKKTPRRSLRKQVESPPPMPQKSLLDIKDFHVKIKKPLDFKGSQIIKTKEETTFIEKLFPIKVYNAKMLYRASDNDFSVKRFHQYCDGQHNTIVFVKTQFNKVIGGFTPIPWKSTNNTIHTDLKKQSFLFSVTLKQKMPLVDEKSAIFNSMNFGPTFGNGADLAICHRANAEKTSYSQFPYSYGNTRYLQNNQHSTFLFTGQQNGNHFLIKEWEVWKLELSE